MVIRPRVCKTDFDFAWHFNAFLMESAFFSELSRHIRKLPTMDIPTAGVMHDPVTDDLILWYNPVWMKKIERSPYGGAKIHGLLTHEFYHIIFQHILHRRPSKYPRLWNIACDAAINSIILASKDSSGQSRALPDGGIIPGEWPTDPEWDKLTQEQKDSKLFIAEIASWPKMQASEWYFQKLLDLADRIKEGCPVHGDGKGPRLGKGKKPKKKPKSQKDKDKNGSGDKQESSGAGSEPSESSEGEPGDGTPDSNPGDQPGSGPGEGQCTCGEGEFGDGFDSHDLWEVEDEAQREHLEARIQDIVSKSTKYADQQGGSGWGSMPADIRDAIRRSLSHQVSWKAVLKQFFGTIHRGERSTSIRKMSRKYPWIHPGMRRGHIPNVLVCVDESGSMSKEAIELLFGELASFSQRFTFDVCKFDTVCGPVETWRKGAPPPTVASSRTKCGGTNFNAAMDLIEAPENRGRWDGVLMLTDGICFQPRQSRIKRGWVLTPGQKLDWETQELVIELTETIRAKGAWR